MWYLFIVILITLVLIIIGLVTRQVIQACNFLDYLKQDRFIEKSERQAIRRRLGFSYALLNIMRSSSVAAFKTIFRDLDKTINKQNDDFAEHEKIRYKDLLANIDGKPFDDQQQNVCVRSENATLVVAGAGSGKTLTICGKVKYLIEKGINPDKLLMISFTNKVCDELRERVKKISDSLSVSPPKIFLNAQKVFHKLIDI